MNKNPLWVIFTIFVFSNGLLAYSELPFGIKLLVGLTGLLVPFLFILLNSKHLKLTPGETGGHFQPRFVPWILAPLAALMFFLRFYKLATFSTWPSTDDGWFGAYALDLYEKWNWNLLFGPIRFPALNFWPQTLLFKILGPSLLSLFLLPAIFSLLTVFFAYGAAKEYFSKPFAFLYAGIAAFSFWPLLLGRIPGGGGVIPILELAVLILLSRTLKNENQTYQNILAGLLGLALIGGFYFSFYYWIACWIWFHFFILWLGFRNKKIRSVLFILFSVEALLSIPLAAVFFQNGMGQYAYSLLFFNKKTVWSGGFNSLSYLTSLLWGADKSGFVYRPQWGGFLNPVSGSFFLLGFMCLLRRWKDPIWRWVLFAVPFFLLPGLLSQTFEMYRIVSLVPLIILITAMGIEFLFIQFPKYIKVFLVLFLMSFFMDTYHLFDVYHQAWAVPGIQWGSFKSLERWRAFEILEQQNHENGPGLIFADFIIRNFDRTLDVATYSFNCDRNRSLIQLKPAWVAIIFPSHLQPFLSRRFPDGKWYELSENLPVSDDNKYLGIIPWREENREMFTQWRMANRCFEEVNEQMLYSKNQMTFQDYENALLFIRPVLVKDPFLESCFDQKILGAFDNRAEPQKALYFTQRGLTYGYPSAFFTRELSDLKK